MYLSLKPDGGGPAFMFLPNSLELRYAILLELFYRNDEFFLNAQKGNYNPVKVIVELQLEKVMKI